MIPAVVVVVALFCLLPMFDMFFYEEAEKSTSVGGGAYLNIPGDVPP